MLCQKKCDKISAHHTRPSSGRHPSPSDPYPSLTDRFFACHFFFSRQAASAILPPHLSLVLSYAAKDLTIEDTKAPHVECPLWVKSRHLHCTSLCPRYPRKRTCAVQLGMSAFGPKHAIISIVFSCAGLLGLFW